MQARGTVSRDWYTSERVQRNGSARQSSVTDPRGSEGPESTPKPGGQANGVPARKPGKPPLRGRKILASPEISYPFHFSPYSGAPEPRKQSYAPSAPTRRTGLVLNSPDPPEALPGDQGDAGEGIR